MKNDTTLLSNLSDNDMNETVLIEKMTHLRQMFIELDGIICIQADY